MRQQWPKAFSQTLKIADDKLTELKYCITMWSIDKENQTRIMYKVRPIFLAAKSTRLQVDPHTLMFSIFVLHFRGKNLRLVRIWSPLSEKKFSLYWKSFFYHRFVTHVQKK